MLSEIKRPREFTAFFPFCGLGAGAMGFLNAEVHLFDTTSRFRSLGGIDIDKDACRDFERLTGSPALCGDMHELTPDDLRRAFGTAVPDVVFSSPPCTGFSGLLSKEVAKKAKYQRLNRLVPRWVELMLETWDPQPRLIIMENVPRITARGEELLVEVHTMLRAAGYLVEQGYHDCGELGGLAQHRKRFLLVGRNPSRCVPVLYKPPIKRVRGCGEVLGELPVPTTRAAERYGKIHELPRISLMNMIRLALIPAGGDWRDIPGALKEGQKRREVHKHHGRVVDPRVKGWRPDPLGVRAWDEASGTITGRAGPSTGRFSVADPRPQCGSMAGVYRTVSGVAPAETTPDADYSSRASVVDPRVKTAYDTGYKVLGWGKSAHTITGTSSCGTGAYQVADPRQLELGELIVSWDGLLRLPAVLGTDPKRPPKIDMVIVSPDGCWHRPMTTLELAALQGLPTDLGKQPLTLTGNAVSGWRKRIGNAVPVQTAQAIAEQMLVTLSDTVDSSLELFPQNGGEYWVEGREDGTEEVLNAHGRGLR